MMWCMCVWVYVCVRAGVCAGGQSLMTGLPSSLPTLFSRQGLFLTAHLFGYAGQQQASGNRLSPPFPDAGVMDAHLQARCLNSGLHARLGGTLLSHSSGPQTWLFLPLKEFLGLKRYLWCTSLRICEAHKAIWCCECFYSLHFFPSLACESFSIPVTTLCVEVLDVTFSH